MKESGRKIRRMEGESILRAMGRAILGSGSRTSSMDSGLRSGMTDHPMRGTADSM